MQRRHRQFFANRGRELRHRVASRTCMGRVPILLQESLTNEAGATDSSTTAALAYWTRIGVSSIVILLNNVQRKPGLEMEECS
jgi:hypothetical protein